MRKLSRLGWLHGVILVSAVVGCKHSCGTGGNCGPGQGGPAGGGAPIYSGSAGTGGVGYPKLFGSAAGTATSQGMSGGQTYPASPGAQGAYPLPASSSTTYPGFGGSQ
jgi:hypothetical protein